MRRKGMTYASAALAAALMISSISTCTWAESGAQTASEAAQTDADQDTANASEQDNEEGTRTATIMVTSITGNEMTYYEVEEKEDAAGTESGAEAAVETESDVETAAGTEAVTAADSSVEAPAGAPSGAPSGDFDPSNMPNGGNFDMSNMPEGAGNFDPSNMPNGGNFDMSNMPEGAGNFDPSNMLNFPGGNGASTDSSSEGNGGFDSSNMPQGGGNFGGSGFGAETVTVQLPVSVPVYTNTGEEMTFSIIEAGDKLDVVFEKDAEGNEVITEMTIVSVSD